MINLFHDRRARYAVCLSLVALLACALLLAGCGKNLPSENASNDTNTVDKYIDPGNWYAGDAHMHSEYSELSVTHDGQGTLEEWADAAFAREHLSWIVMTEHGPNLGFENGYVSTFDIKRARNRWNEATSEMESLESSGKAGCMMLGEEMGTAVGGHLVAFQTSDYVVDSPFDMDESGFIQRVGEAGGFCFIAHPFEEQFQIWLWPDFERYITGIDTQSTLRGFELLSGTHNDPELNGLLKIWDKHLLSGERVLVIGSTDAHKPEDVGKAIRTYVYVEGRDDHRLNGEDHDRVLDALRNGHSVVTTGPVAFFMVTNRRTGEVAGIGDELGVQPGDMLEISTRCDDQEVPCKEIKIYGSILPQEGLTLSPDQSQEIQVPEGEGVTAGSTGYLRLEGYRESGAQREQGACYSNPIFLTF